LTPSAHAQRSNRSSLPFSRTCLETGIHFLSDTAKLIADFKFKRIAAHKFQQHDHRQPHSNWLRHSRCSNPDATVRAAANRFPYSFHLFHRFTQSRVVDHNFVSQKQPAIIIELEFVRESH
jgi:hypothetical protein